jgi:hypothetical protein
MLVGRPRSRGSRYIDIVGDGVWVATWRRAQWGDPGQLSAAGYGYTVRGPSFGMRSELLAPNGRVVAYTHRFGPRRWTLTTDDRDYVFVDATPARHGMLLVRAPGLPAHHGAGARDVRDDRGADPVGAAGGHCRVLPDGRPVAPCGGLTA